MKKQLKSQLYEKIICLSRNGLRVTSSSPLRWRTDGFFQASDRAAGATCFLLRRWWGAQLQFIREGFPFRLISASDLLSKFRKARSGAASVAP
jgi:hypothetical protein